MKDDKETAIALFELINTIVRQTVSEKKRVDEVWGHIPESKKEGIKNRDN